MASPESTLNLAARKVTELKDNLPHYDVDVEMLKIVNAIIDETIEKLSAIIIGDGGDIDYDLFPQFVEDEEQEFLNLLTE